MSPTLQNKVTVTLSDQYRFESEGPVRMRIAQTADPGWSAIHLTVAEAHELAAALVAAADSWKP